MAVLQVISVVAEQAPVVHSGHDEDVGGLEELRVVTEAVVAGVRGNQHAVFARHLRRSPLAGHVDAVKVEVFRRRDELLVQHVVRHLLHRGLEAEEAPSLRLLLGEADRILRRAFQHEKAGDVDAVVDHVLAAEFTERVVAHRSDDSALRTEPRRRRNSGGGVAAGLEQMRVHFRDRVRPGDAVNGDRVIHHGLTYADDVEFLFHDLYTILSPSGRAETAPGLHRWRGIYIF